MFLTTPAQETLADFMAEALICQECRAEMAVVGPLPANPACAACGSRDVVAVLGASAAPRPQQDSQRRAA